MRPDGPATINDVAATAQVSATTVSHVISGNRPVSEATRQRVVDAVEALQYRPNAIARSLRTRRSHTVALLVPDITNPVYPEIARGVQEALTPAGYHSVIANTDTDEELEREIVEDMVQRQVDGVIMAAFASSPEVLTRTGIPMVSIGSAIDDPRVDVVVGENHAGARRAVEHLLGLGHRDIGLLIGDRGPGPQRRGGYREALESAGVPLAEELVADGGWTRAGGAEAMERLLDGGAPLSAVFAANDLMAIGAMTTLRARGMRVPEDFSVVGFDNIEAAELIFPLLTTVEWPAREFGRTAGRLLLERTAGEHTGSRRRLTLPCPLIRRASATERTPPDARSTRPG